MAFFWKSLCCLLAIVFGFYCELTSYIPLTDRSASEDAINDDDTLIEKSESMAAVDRELLNAYQHSFDDDRVDCDLIMTLLKTIHAGSQDGKIN